MESCPSGQLGGHAIIARLQEHARKGERYSTPQDDQSNPGSQGNDETKIETMKRILTVMITGDTMPGLLM